MAEMNAKLSFATTLGPHGGALGAEIGLAKDTARARKCAKLGRNVCAHLRVFAALPPVSSGVKL